MYVEYLLVGEGGAAARPAGEVDRDPLREHGRDVPRPRRRCSTSSSASSATARSSGCGCARSADAGAYPAIGAFLPFFTQMMAQGVYAIPKVEFNWQAAVTNTTPTARVPRRGPARGDAPRRAHPRHRGRRARHRPGRDPRARTSSRPTRSRTRRSPARPTTAASTRRRSTRVLEHAGYDELRAEQAGAPRARRPECCSASASRRTSRSPRRSAVHRSTARSRSTTTAPSSRTVGTSSHGQGHETAFSMIVERRCSASRWSNVHGRPVRHRDRAAGRRHRWVPLAADRRQRGATSRARRCSTQAKQLAAHLLEANADDIVVGDGGLEVAGVPAEHARRGPSSRPRRRTRRAGPTACRSAARARARLQPGRLDVPVRRAHRGRRGRQRDRPRRAAAPHRGRRLRHDPQPDARRGPAARRHRARASRRRCTSRCSYDDDGNPLTGEPHGLRDAVARPSSRASRRPTPRRRRPLNPLGAKGIGESATIGSTPAVHNAVVDALSHLGVRHIDMPCTAERVWRAIQDAKRLHELASSPTPTLRLTESQYRVDRRPLLRRPARRGVRAARRPGRAGERADGRRHRGAPVHATRTRRPSRTPSTDATCCGAMRDAEARGDEIVGVWHTHTHTDAYPSPTDVRQAVDPTGST